MTDAEGNEIGKVFIGGLSQATNDDSLRHYFAQFGRIEDCVVMMDNKTGRSRGFGYIKFQDDFTVRSVLEAGPHLLDGKIVDVKQCNIHMKGRNRRSLKIFVGGIGLDDNDDSIRHFFSQFGNVTDVNLMLDQSKQRHRGFAFVGFDDECVVKDLIIKHFVTMNGKCVEIKAMEPPNFARKLVVSSDNGGGNGVGLPGMIVCNSLAGGADPNTASMQSMMAGDSSVVSADGASGHMDEKLLRVNSHPHYALQPLVWGANGGGQTVWNNPYQFDKVLGPGCVYPHQQPQQPQHQQQQQAGACPHYHQCLANPGGQSMWTMLPQTAAPTTSTAPTWPNYHQIPANPLIQYPSMAWQYNPYVVQFPQHAQFRPVPLNPAENKLSSQVPEHLETAGPRAEDMHQPSCDGVPPNISQMEALHHDDNNWMYGINKELSKINHSQLNDHIIRPNGDENSKQQLPFNAALTDFSFFQSTY